MNLRCPICKSSSIAISLSNQAPESSFISVKEWSPLEEKEACITVEEVKDPINLQPDFPCVCQNCAYSATLDAFGLE